MLRATGEAHADSLRRAHMAMSAHSPIAHKVSGSALVPERRELSFLRSLALSRWLFGPRVARLPAAHLRRLNAARMRGLRRVAGDCRFGPDAQWSGRVVREQLKAASIDIQRTAALPPEGATVALGEAHRRGLRMSASSGLGASCHA